jgi:hypothetical protein
MAMNKWWSTVIAMLRHAFLASLSVLLSSGIILMCISICCYAIYVHCTVCFPLHLSGYFIIALDSLCHFRTVLFCSLI